jgi:hypothetical protein
MNNAGNALLTNSGNAISSAANSVNHTFSTFGTWILIGGIILLLVLAYMMYQNQLTIMDVIPGLDKTPRDWRELQRREAQTERKDNAGFGENWCFVGEDVTGRWCVKVPQPDACSPERLFSSRPGCELVPTSPLPLGLVANGGAAMNPLLAAAHTK